MNRMTTRALLCAAAFALAPAALSAQAHGHGGHGAAPAQPARAQQTCGDMEIIGHGPLHVAIEHAEEFALSAAQRAGLDSIAVKLRTDLRAAQNAAHAGHSTANAAQMQQAQRAAETRATALRRAADEAALARLTATQRQRLSSSGHGGEHHGVGSAHPACTAAAAAGHGAHGGSHQH